MDDIVSGGTSIVLALNHLFCHKFHNASVTEKEDCATTTVNICDHSLWSCIMDGCKGIEWVIHRFKFKSSVTLYLAVVLMSFYSVTKFRIFPPRNVMNLFTLQQRQTYWKFIFKTKTIANLFATWTNEKNKYDLILSKKNHVFE